MTVARFLSSVFQQPPKSHLGEKFSQLMAVGHPLRRTPLWRVLRGLNLIESDLLDSMKNQVEKSLQNIIQEQLEMGSGEVAELCAEILLAGGKRVQTVVDFTCIRNMWRKRF